MHCYRARLAAITQRAERGIPERPAGRAHSDALCMGRVRVPGRASALNRRFLNRAHHRRNARADGFDTPGRFTAKGVRCKVRPATERAQ
jgi:hypothetical protein